MIEFVKEYLDGKMSRMDFDLDFSQHIKKYYPKMERDIYELADCFYFYLVEEGYDHSEYLTDGEHKKLIRRQFNEFMSAMNDDIL
jgi:hypothetical protein